MGIDHGPVTLLLVGLDNAGKTTAAKGIIGDSIENVAPTVGFSPETLEYRGCEITIYDLGGGPRIRAVWPKYFSEIHGVIFVIDSSDKMRIEECHVVLEELLSHKKVSGKPVLVLANKQDIEGALDEIDLVETLKIEQIVNNYKCPTRVETCSAIAIHKKKPDKPIADGFRWLIDTIVVHYASLHKRVEGDVEEEQIRLKEEMERRKERLKQLREERERKELEKEAQLVAVQKRKDSDDAFVVVEKQGAERLSHVDDDFIALLSRTSESQEARSFNLTNKDETEESPNSSSEAKELEELGFKSPSSLNSTKSSSSSASYRTERAIIAKEPRSPHLIQVHPSPSDASDSHQLTPSEIGSQSMNNLLESDSYKEIHFEDSLPRASECVPIDSDDEMFASTIRAEENKIEVQLNSSPQPAIANGSVIAGIKEQIELEASLNRKPKRKNFLKRLHKTAPMGSSSVSNGLIAPEEGTLETLSGRIP